VDAGLLTLKELEQLDAMLAKTEGKHDISWLPIQWAQELARQCRFEKETLPEGPFLLMIHKALVAITENNRTLYMYSWISIPLVYTQVVTMAVYSYFLAALFGRQYLQPQEYVREGGVYVRADGPEYETADKKNLVGYDMHTFDMIIPCFTLLEFLFYFGWLKVAESLINPFGDDDDDFETNYVIDRNLQLSYLMVEVPEIDHSDPFGETNIPPTEMPHTISSLEYKDVGPQLPTDNFIMNELEMIDSRSRASLIGTPAAKRRPAFLKRFSKQGRRQYSIKSSISNRQRLEELTSERAGHVMRKRSISVLAENDYLASVTSRMTRLDSFFRRSRPNHTSTSNINSRANSTKSCRTIDSPRVDIPDTIIEQESKVPRSSTIIVELDLESDSPTPQGKPGDNIHFSAKADEEE